LRERALSKTGKILAVAKFLLLIVIAVGVPLLLWFRHPEFVDNFRSFDSVNALIEERTAAMLLFFLALQIFQVIVSVIPAQAVQIAAGYAYNFWIAYLVCVAGLVAGTVLTYFIAKLLGRDAMHLLFGEERIAGFVDKLNSKKAYILLFIIFLVPGIPKDIFAYAAGLSEMKALAFFLISLVARTPALMASILFGGMIRSGSRMGMIILGAAIVLLFLLGLKFHDKLAELVNRFYDRMVG
jgi:uncharacterized membrane protein YdjX (TVP38/TMEM64 family)